MDPRNRFESRGTFMLVRLENLAAFAACTVLAVMHIGDIRWLHFFVLFAYIDLFGYIPGAIAYHRSGGGAIARVYYVLYNTLHSFLFNGLVIAGWCLFFGPSWALLAVPIHLFGDRALFGNSFKPWGVSFEPKLHPAFAQFERDFGGPKTRPNGHRP